MKTAAQFVLVPVLCLVSCVSAESQWPLGKELAHPAMKSGETPSSITLTGRYQMFVSPNAKGHTFMIDTDTGRLWVMTKDAASGNFSLQRIPVEEVDTRKPDASPQEPAKGEKAHPAR